MKFGLRMARAGFRKSKHKKPVGASLVLGNQIIVAYNDPKSAPMMNRFYGFKVGLHAEAALFSTRIPRHSFVGAEVFVYRERKDGSLGDTKPCSGCTAILRSHGVKWVTYYSTTTESWVRYRL